MKKFFLSILIVFSAAGAVCVEQVSLFRSGTVQLGSDGASPVDSGADPAAADCGKYCFFHFCRSAWGDDIHGAVSAVLRGGCVSSADDGDLPGRDDSNGGFAAVCHSLSFSESTFLFS